MTRIGACLFGCKTTRLLREEARFFFKTSPFGFILFDRNIETPDQLRRLTRDLRDSVGRHVPIFIDQEGGRVQRLRPPHWFSWAPPLETEASLPGEEGQRAIWLRYRIIAHELRASGIDGNCVPVADVATDTTHPILMNRCLGRDARRVALLARSAAEGSMAGGVLPVVKHMPGHGRATADSHVELPRTAASKAYLLEKDFAPFRSLSDLPLGMTAHVVFESLDPHRPATHSQAVIDLIRRDIGFRGLLMTDDISMSALTGTISARCEQAVQAGCDLVLHCNGRLEEMREVAAASGSIPQDSRLLSNPDLIARRQDEYCEIAPLLHEYAELTGMRPSRKTGVRG